MTFRLSAGWWSCPPRCPSAPTGECCASAWPTARPRATPSCTPCCGTSTAGATRRFSTGSSTGDRSAPRASAGTPTARTRCQSLNEGRRSCQTVWNEAAGEKAGRAGAPGQTHPAAATHLACPVTLVPWLGGALEAAPCVLKGSCRAVSTYHQRMTVGCALAPLSEKVL